MINVNGNEMAWIKGLTVIKFLNENNFLPHLSVVKINGELIKKSSFSTQIINDSDTIKIIHLVAGG